MKTITINIPQSDNKKHGFYGTIHSNKRVAWDAAVIAFHKATGVAPAAIAVWLDGTRGRHFADTVNDTAHDIHKTRKVASSAVRVEQAVQREVGAYMRSKHSKAEFAATAYSWYAETLTEQHPPKSGVFTHTFEKGEWVQRASA